MAVNRDMHDADPRNPTKALAAVGVGIFLIVVLWSFELGPWSLVLTPLLVPYVISVYLGGKLNENTFESVDRIRAFRDRRR